MTTSNQPAYTAPDGFYKSYTFDKTGNVFADGKALNGVRLDISTLKPPAEKNAFGLYTNSVMQGPNSYAAGGGQISRLSIDDQGNVFANVAAPQTEKPTGVGTYGPGIFSHMAAAGIGDMVNQQQSPAQMVKLSGIALDPARTSRSAGGAIGDNQAYIRPDKQDGVYFIQVNKGDSPVAYAYNNVQLPTNPAGGPTQTTSTRRQGGNAGGSSGPSAPDDTTLLGT